MSNHVKSPEEVRKSHPDWNISMIENDMDTVVNCCSCGKKLKYGDSYTSMNVQSELGFGYAECGECYFKK